MQSQCSWHWIVIFAILRHCSRRMQIDHGMIPFLILGGYICRWRVVAHCLTAVAKDPHSKFLDLHNADHIPLPILYYCNIRSYSDHLMSSLDTSAPHYIPNFRCTAHRTDPQYRNPSCTPQHPEPQARSPDICDLACRSQVTGPTICTL